MGVPDGVHHLAIATGDMKAQLEYFTQVVGAELVALYWMHGVENTYHGFVKLGEHSSIAFVQSPRMPRIEGIPGVSHAGTTAGDVAPGAMQHVALNVPSEADLLAMRDRVRSQGHWIMGPIDHGFCKSIYLAAPEGIMLEFSTWTGELDPEAWIDPEIVELCGISAEELKRYKSPPPFVSRGGKVPQPERDPRKPQMAFPPDSPLLRMTDDEVAEFLSETKPPVETSK